MDSIRTPRRRILAALLAASALLGALAPAHARSAGLSQVTVTQMMNWYPQPELGGQFAADSLGYYRQAGLNERMLPFDPNADQSKLLDQGKLTFGMMSADQLLESRAKGLKVVAVMNTFQINPQGFLWHAGENIHSLADLSNRVIIHSPGSAWWLFLVQKYHYKDLTQIANDFSFKQFYARQDSVLECYVTSEPYVAHQAGQDVHWSLIADSGFDAYPEVLVTSERMVREHPDTIKAYVDASLRGWNTFIADPTSTLNVLEKYPDAKNYPLSPNAMLFSYLQLRSLVTGGEAKLHGIGTMSKARYTELAAQLQGVGFGLKGINIDKAYTLQFVPH